MAPSPEFAKRLVPPVLLFVLIAAAAAGQQSAWARPATAAAAQMTITVVVVGPAPSATPAPTAGAADTPTDRDDTSTGQTPGDTTIMLPSVVGGAPTPPVRIAEDGEVFGLLGALTPAEDQPFSTYLVTADQAVFGLVGSTPAVEQQIVALAGAGSGQYAKVWGRYRPGTNEAATPTIVVSDIIGAEGPDDEQSPPLGQSNPVVTVKFDLVNLRTGPGNRFPPAGQVTMGQVCDVIGRNELATWYLIDCLGGESGWMDSRLVDLQGDAQSAPVVTESGELQPTPTPPPVSAATPTPTPAVQPPPTDYWQVTFFNNTTLSEPSVLDAAAGDVNFDWGSGAPNPAVAANQFSARFRRTIDFPTGYYRFLAEADDGIRVYLDGEVLIDEWHGATGATYSTGRYLSGRRIVTIDYFQSGGNSRVRFWYESLGNSPEWRASYFGGIDLLGVPVFEQPEASTPSRPIDYFWGATSPAPAQLASDFWSGRWIGRFRFETGNYIFNSVSDDGVRLYLNDTLVIDRWSDGRGTSTVRFIGVGADEHTVRVEFYERTGSAELTVWWYRESGSQFAP